MFSYPRYKKLICHYCGGKSDLIFDGTIFHWECKKCNAINYLDENGDITDPPVSADTSTSSPIKYTTSYESDPALHSNTNIFCGVCLKNQHLYTSSLAQYHIDIDTSHHENSNTEAAYSRFLKGLERRYPQVCEKCEPFVLQRIKEADKTAKTDHLWRLMDKTRSDQLKSTKNSFLSYEILGKTLWNIGLYGQLIWNLMTISNISLHILNDQTQNKLPSFIPDLFQPIITITISRTWSFRALMSTVLSVWWCPNCDGFKGGIKKPTSGVRKWYFLQFTATFFRIIFYFIMGTRFFSSRPLSLITLITHAFSLFLITSISSRAFGALKVNIIPPWNPGLESKELRPQTISTLSEDVESIEDVLHHIELSSKSSNTPVYDNKKELDLGPNRLNEALSLDSLGTTSESLISNSQLSKKKLQTQLLSAGSVQQYIPRQSYNRSSGNLGNQVALSNPNVVEKIPARTTPSLLEMSEQEVTSYLQTGRLPDKLTYEEMDWQPTLAQHRGFSPRPKLDVQQFSKIPVSNEPSPFWYRVPAAPITPAQKIRNPPIKPCLQVPPKKTKETFFQKFNRIDSNYSHSVSETKTSKNTVGHTIELSHPRFFPPETSGDTESILADLLTDFSLSNQSNTSRSLFHKASTHHLSYSVLTALIIPFIPIVFYYITNYFLEWLENT